jgi:hypothetical protein
MSSEDIYRGQKGGLFKIERLTENPVFFRYKKSQEDSENLATDLTSNNSRGIVSKAGSFGDQATEPAVNDISPGENKTDHVK